MGRPFILAINGSPSRSGRTAQMAKEVLSEAKKLGAKVRLVHLANYKILPHSGKLGKRKFIENTKDDMPKLQDLVLQADGIVFATPTHWFNVSSLMKLFVDRLTSLEEYGFLMEGKAAGFITYGPEGGALNPAMLLMITANQMGMAVPPYAAIFDENRNDWWIKKAPQVLAKNMIRYIGAWKGMKINWGFLKEDYEVSPIELLPKKIGRK
jgi:multimeric flavodoxin WrbA